MVDAGSKDARDLRNEPEERGVGSLHRTLAFREVDRMGRFRMCGKT